MGKKKRARKNVAATPSLAAPPATARGFSDLWIVLALALAIFAVYAQVRGHQFIGLDDDHYIRDNPMVARGLTPAGVAWAFTTFYAANWHPLTWLSHMLDSQLFGLNPGAHLLVNVFLHTANAALVFWFLRRATGARWPSAFVAALFALHPVHVESVAWAAERKDVLAAFFGLAALVAYTRYVERQTRRRLALVALLLALGLMAKPMLVTWPFLLLLLDLWPFRRLTFPAPKVSRQIWPLLREKLALFAIVAASIVVTFITQARGGAVRPLEEMALGLRISNAIVSYARYFLATFWPVDLAVYRPFPPGGIPAWQVVGALLLLLALSALAIRQFKRRPYLLVGWLWFLGTLVPVIGLVQVGGQAWADRYHYLPSIGLFVALAFAAAGLAASWKRARLPLAASALLALLACAALTARQVARWRDSITLFTHTLAVTPPNLVIEHNLAHALGQERRYEEALVHFQNALRLKPDFVEGLINTGMTLASLGRPAEAIPYFERALRVDPASAKAHMQMALALVQTNQKPAALREFRRALELAPADAAAHTNLGLMLARQGAVAEGMVHLREAVRLAPDSAEAQNNLGLVLFAQGNARESIPHFEAAIRLKPGLTVAQENLRRARAQLEARRD